MLDEFEGKTLTILALDFPKAAAPLIERGKSAEWRLFSSNTGNWPVWTDVSIITAPSYDANTGQHAVRVSSGQGHENF